MKINAIAPWYGSNRTLAENVGRALDGCGWVGIPFAGSMTEVRFIKARTILVNDKHEALMNLAAALSNREHGPMLYRRLRRLPFHPVTLAEAQYVAKKFEDEPPTEIKYKLTWAEAYFVCVWMGRSANAGTDTELESKLSVRWSATGGDSAVRYQNAIASIPAWRRLLKRCQFSTLDVFDFLKDCKDTVNTGIYCDPPFPGAGDKYKHKFDEYDHECLARELSLFGSSRIVCRFYDDPLIRRLYSDSEWEWTSIDGGRDQKNTKDKPEVLIVRNG